MLHSAIHLENFCTITSSLHQIKWLDKEGVEIETKEKKKNIVDEEEEVEGTKLHNAVSTIKLKVTVMLAMIVVVDLRI